MSLLFINSSVSNSVLSQRFLTAPGPGITHCGARHTASTSMYFCREDVLQRRQRRVNVTAVSHGFPPEQRASLCGHLPSLLTAGLQAQGQGSASCLNPLNRGEGQGVRCKGEHSPVPRSRADPRAPCQTR